MSTASSDPLRCTALSFATGSVLKVGMSYVGTGEWRARSLQEEEGHCRLDALAAVVMLSVEVKVEVIIPSSDGL